MKTTTKFIFAIVMTFSHQCFAVPSIFTNKVMSVDGLGFSSVSCVPREGEAFVEEVSLSVHPTYLETYMRHLGEDSNSYTAIDKIIVQNKKPVNVKQEYFYCDTFEKQEKKIIDYAVNNTNHLESDRYADLDFINANLIQKVAKFTLEDQRKLLSIDEKKRWSALGQILVEGKDKVGKSSAFIVELEGENSNKTIVVTNAHALISDPNKPDGLSAKDYSFCLGQDTSKAENRECYKIDPSNIEFGTYAPYDGYFTRDWAVIVLDQKITKTKLKEEDIAVNPFIVRKTPVNFEELIGKGIDNIAYSCLLYTSPSPRDRTRSRMPSSA